MELRSTFLRGGLARLATMAACLGVVIVSGILPALPIDGGRAEAADANYKVAVGDILRVDVEGRTDISGQFPVEKGGGIALPILGTVPAAGRTTADIGSDISRRMSLISTKLALVAVSVAEYRSGQYFVLGAVLLPGMYLFAQPPTVWEAIAEAGGPAQDADLSVVEILSEAQPKPTFVNLSAVATGDFSNLPRLRPGDTVRVQRLTAVAGGTVAGEEAVVYVFGAVGAQGPQPLNMAPDLVRAFIRSGPGADANYKNVEIVRRNGAQVVRLKVNMDEYFGKGSIVGNPALQAGDTIHFPRDKGTFSPLRIIGVLGSIVGVVTSIVVLTN